MCSEPRMGALAANADERGEVEASSPEQGAVIAEDHAGGVVAGGAGDAAAGMGAGAAMVQAF